jgi:hypothetical protein
VPVGQSRRAEPRSTSRVKPGASRGRPVEPMKPHARATAWRSQGNGVHAPRPCTLRPFGAAPIVSLTVRCLAPRCAGRDEAIVRCTRRVIGVALSTAFAATLPACSADIRPPAEAIDTDTLPLLILQEERGIGGAPDPDVGSAAVTRADTVRVADPTELGTLWPRRMRIAEP